MCVFTAISRAFTAVYFECHSMIRRREIRFGSPSVIHGTLIKDSCRLSATPLQVAMGKLGMDLNWTTVGGQPEQHLLVLLYWRNISRTHEKMAQLMIISFFITEANRSKHFFVDPNFRCKPNCNPRTLCDSNMENSIRFSTGYQISNSVIIRRLKDLFVDGFHWEWRLRKSVWWRSQQSNSSPMNFFQKA